VLKFDLGQLILSENEENKYIWRVKEGEVKLQRANSSLSILGVGAIFGELSIFSSRNKMNAAVISNMASTEVYRISPPLLWTLFESDPQLGYRFYRWLAAKLCRRLLTYAVFPVFFHYSQFVVSGKSLTSKNWNVLSKPENLADCVEQNR